MNWTEPNFCIACGNPTSLCGCNQSKQIVFEKAELESRLEQAARQIADELDGKGAYEWVLNVLQATLGAKP